jgi:hypothetical protein
MIIAAYLLTVVAARNEHIDRIVAEDLLAGVMMVMMVMMVIVGVVVSVAIIVGVVAIAGNVRVATVAWVATEVGVSWKAAHVEVTYITHVT